MSSLNYVKNKNKLQLLWRQKLKASGFKDIENEYEMLHSWDSFRFANIEPDHFYAVRDKYIEAAQLPELYKIRNQVELDIWTHYADGLSYRDIGELVGKNKDFVQRVVWKLNSILTQLRKKNDSREE
jgi:hypothetical protein